MDVDEKEICEFLKTWRGQFVSAKEVCRRAGGKWRFRENEKWAVPVLKRLLEKGLVEADAFGHYRLLKDTKRSKSKRWVSPELKRILDKSGRAFDNVVDIDVDLESPSSDKNG